MLESGDACSGGDRTVVVWTRDAGGVYQPAALRCHSHIAWQAAFSPSGRRCATVSEDGTAVVLDVVSRQELACFAPKVGMRAVCFINEDELLCGGGDGSLFVVHLA